MKKIIILWAFFTSLNTFGAEAIVIVLNAPYLKEANLDSKVLQYVRKGEKVFVPNDILKLKELPEFIPTFDRVGNEAFIPSEYLKIITNNEQEYSSPIRIAGSDPTDYRLEEPIPSTFPFTSNAFLKTSFSLSYANNNKSAYDYQKTITQQDYTSEKGGRFLLTRRVKFDKYDRFYFGLFFNISSCQNFFNFSDSTSATEKRGLFKIGPYISYDVFSGRNLRITFGSGFTYNYHKTVLQYRGLNKSSEERFFTGFSLSPIVSTYVQVENYFPGFDLIAGTDLNLYFKKTLTATTPASVQELWPSESIKEDLKPMANLYLGVQFKY